MKMKTFQFVESEHSDLVNSEHEYMYGAYSLSRFLNYREKMGRQTPQTPNPIVLLVSVPLAYFAVGNWYW